MCVGIYKVLFQENSFLCNQVMGNFEEFLEENAKKWTHYWQTNKWFTIYRYSASVKWKAVQFDKKNVMHHKGTKKVTSHSAILILCIAAEFWVNTYVSVISISSIALCFTSPNLFNTELFWIFNFTKIFNYRYFIYKNGRKVMLFVVYLLIRKWLFVGEL